MPSFAVRYRSRGEVREVRWTDGRLSAEPLVETVVAALIREKRAVRRGPGTPRSAASIDDAESAALTVLEALYEVGAHIIRWDGDLLGIGDERSGNEHLR
jgi:hypothetical protein